MKLFSHLPLAAQVIYSGGGLNEGIDRAREITGTSNRTLREVVESALLTVLSYLALAAVVMIVIAGIWLIVGGGSDNAKDRAKKILTYTFVGLIVILIAQAIVLLVTTI